MKTLLQLPLIGWGLRDLIRLFLSAFLPVLFFLFASQQDDHCLSRLGSTSCYTDGLNQPMHLRTRIQRINGFGGALTYLRLLNLALAATLVTPC